MSIRILQGDCREVLATLPDASVQCCVTSPPYYGLRDYGVAGQIGLEQTPAEYVEQMVAVFREVRRALRDDGTVWLNLGDSYAGGGGFSPNAPSSVTSKSGLYGGLGALKSGGIKPQGLMKAKDLLGIPWRVAFALQADGWWLRSDIIWAKPNPMPESVTDRPTSAHEHVFLLAKRERYFFDAEAVREQFVDERMGNPGAYSRTTSKAKGANNDRQDGGFLNNGGGWNADGANVGRNIRNVWTIATQPYAEAHFATFPPELAERCIKAGTSERGCCANCGAPWVRKVERETRPNWQGGDGQKHDGTHYRPNPGGGVGNDSLARVDRGWAPTCACNAAVAPCTVLDPFGGAGTTALVADRLGRNAILIELNQQYCDLARNRLTKDAGLFAEVAA